MKASIFLFSSLIIFFFSVGESHKTNNIQSEKYAKPLQTAIQSFSQTKLFIMDSVFIVSIYDTLHRLELKKVKENNYAWVVGKIYPEIISVSIISNQFKFLLDTTVSIASQNKTIPSRVLEKDGRLFVWLDKHYPLTDSSLRILDKFHVIKRGIEKDWYKLFKGTDDSKRGIHFYFCRNDLSIYKKVITNTALGYYDPPNISCK